VIIAEMIQITPTKIPPHPDVIFKNNIENVPKTAYPITNGNIIKLISFSPSLFSYLYTAL
jgi:hypothetical protein